MIAEPALNALVISSTAENVEALAEVVAMFDRLPITDAVTVQLFPLQNISADQFARIVRELFSQGKRLGTVAGTELQGIPGGQGLASGVRVREIYADERTKFEPLHAPYHPAANEAGYVLRSNVNMFKELVDMSIVERSFQANLSALRTYRNMLQATVQNIGR